MLGTAFLCLSWAPLWHTDLWVHLKYGQWIWTNWRVPRTELFMPLAEGVRYQDDAWLSQLIFYGGFTAARFEGLSLLYASTVVTLLAFLLAAGHRATGRLWLAVVTLVVLTPCLLPHLVTIRPTLFGALLFVAILYIVLARTWHVSNWVLIPLLFVAWVNLHSSFLLGLAVLACCALGHTVEAWHQRKRFGSVLGHHDAVRWFLVFELALVACLVNPYGLGLLQAISTMARSPNLRYLVDWGPLSVQSWTGIAFVASIVILVWLLRVSKRPVRGSEGLLLLAFGIASLSYTGSTIWWWLLIPFLYLPHIGEILDQRWPCHIYTAVRDFKNTMIAVALAWILVACSGPGRAMIHHDPRKLEKVLSRLTPLETSEYVREHRPIGQIFNPVDWGDWLVWYGPTDLKCLVSSQVDLVPEEIWRAYQRVYQGEDNWERTLQSLGIRTIIIDKERQKELLNVVRLSANWKIVHEDKLGVVAERARPEPIPHS
ncbi:MAG: hypothetical protein HY000_39075 [Planctomycetes bacterium]|nr:hypothetical protein [Planctomycetota bacterium]